MDLEEGPLGVLELSDIICNLLPHLHFSGRRVFVLHQILQQPQLTSADVASLLEARLGPSDLSTLWLPFVRRA